MLSIRSATADDIPLILQFIRELAELKDGRDGLRLGRRISGQPWMNCGKLRI